MFKILRHSLVLVIKLLLHSVPNYIIGTFVTVPPNVTKYDFRDFICKKKIYRPIYRYNM